MNFREALSILAPYQPAVLSRADAESCFYGVRLLPTAEANLSPEILYIGYDSQMPATLSNVNIYSFVLVSSSAESKRCLQNINANIALVGSEYKSQKIYDLFRDRLELQFKVSSSINTMTNALFSNKGLLYLMENAYTLLKNPIWLISTDNTLIAQAPIDCEELSDIRWESFLSEEIAHLVKSDSSDINNLQADTYCQFPFGPRQEEMIVYPIRVQGIMVGRLCSLARFCAFGSTERTILRQLVALVSQELQRNSGSQSNYNNAQVFFLNDLLSYQSIALEVLRPRMRNIGFVQGKHLYVAVFRSSDGGEQDISRLARQLQSFLPTSIFLIRDNECVGLLNMNRPLVPNYDDQYRNGHIHDCRIEEMLHKQAVLNRIIIGISHMFHDVSQTRAHYIQAKRVIDIRDHYNSYGVFYFSLAAPMEMLHVIQQHDDLSIYCDPGMLNLIQYDKRKNTDLATTLFCYLENMCNLTQAAAALHIHKNTLHYRLEKIRQIISTDFYDGETVYRLMLSFRILSALRLFTPPPEYLNTPFRRLLASDPSHSEDR